MNIVLVHGILGFSHIDVPLDPIDYFAGIAEFLQERFQAQVIAPMLDPTAGTKARAGALRGSIRAALVGGKLNPAEPIHIIAHSMGGLDARRMISEDPTIDIGASRVPVKALATIATPHRGSPIADVVALKFLSLIPVIAPVLSGAENALGNVLAHFRISLDGLHDLTSEAADHFKADCPDQPKVRYMSYAGAGRPGRLAATSLFFLPYHEFIRAQTRGREDSDGVVTVSSARYGEFDETLWPGDHADEIGHDLDFPLQKPPTDTLKRFERVVQRF